MGRIPANALINGYEFLTHFSYHYGPSKRTESAGKTFFDWWMQELAHVVGRAWQVRQRFCRRCTRKSLGLKSRRVYFSSNPRTTPQTMSSSRSLSMGGRWIFHDLKGLTQWAVYGGVDCGFSCLQLSWRTVWHSSVS